ncbi:MAG TPA: STAS domain-containing protein [Spirochaetota bacterium]|nr:STAS domain-containing protein [Spirochaetota bacterium]
MKPEGIINIKNINNFYTELKNEISINNEIIIDFSNVNRIDTSAAQVIIAAGEKVKELKKVLKITGISHDLKTILKLAGIKNKSE